MSYKTNRLWFITFQKNKSDIEFGHKKNHIFENSCPTNRTRFWTLWYQAMSDEYSWWRLSHRSLNIFVSSSDTLCENQPNVTDWLRKNGVNLYEIMIWLCGFECCGWQVTTVVSGDGGHIRFYQIKISFIVMWLAHKQTGKNRKCLDLFNNHTSQSWWILLENDGTIRISLHHVSNLVCVAQIKWKLFNRKWRQTRAKRGGNEREEKVKWCFIGKVFRWMRKAVD